MKKLLLFWALILLSACSNDDSHDKILGSWRFSSDTNSHPCSESSGYDFKSDNTAVSIKNYRNANTGRCSEFKSNFKWQKVNETTYTFINASRIENIYNVTFSSNNKTMQFTSERENGSVITILKRK